MAPALLRTHPEFVPVGEEQQADLIARFERGDGEAGRNVGRPFADCCFTGAE